MLRAGGLGAATVLAGCSEGSDPRTTARTTAGTDSYGITVANRMSKAFLLDADGATEVDDIAVRLRVRRPFEDRTLWERVVNIGLGAERSFEEVITERVEQVVVAEFPKPHHATADPPLTGDDLEPYRSDQLWITPGSDTAPPVADLRVIVAAERIDMESIGAFDVAKVRFARRWAPTTTGDTA